MSKRSPPFGRSLPAVLAGCCLVYAVVVTAEFVFNLAHRPTVEESITVTGLALPRDDSEDLLVHTDVGTFAVSSALRHSVPRDDVWFLFRIGGRYRVSAQGREHQSVLGHFRPTIVEVHRLESVQVAGVGVDR